MPVRAARGFGGGVGVGRRRSGCRQTPKPRKPSSASTRQHRSHRDSRPDRYSHQNKTGPLSPRWSTKQANDHDRCPSQQPARSSADSRACAGSGQPLPSPWIALPRVPVTAPGQIVRVCRIGSPRSCATPPCTPFTNWPCCAQGVTRPRRPDEPAARLSPYRAEVDVHAVPAAQRRRRRSGFWGRGFAFLVVMVVVTLPRSLYGLYRRRWWPARPGVPEPRRSQAGLPPAVPPGGLPSPVLPATAGPGPRGARPSHCRSRRWPGPDGGVRR